MHPEVQTNAQREIDEVVGSGRLPTMQDRESLPYVSAIIKENMRWHAVVPLGKCALLLFSLHGLTRSIRGVIHATAEDDEYNGYFLPKGTYVVPNSWYVLRYPALAPSLTFAMCAACFDRESGVSSMTRMSMRIQ